MKVRATSLGYIYHKRRREGDVFELKTIKGHKRNADGKLEPMVLTPQQQFSKSWMELVDAEDTDVRPEKATSRPRKKVEQQSVEEQYSDDDVI